MSTNFKAGFFGIDYQNDFMDQPNATLGVAGALADAKRASDWLIKISPFLTSFYLTQDSHHVMDIAHPKWWKKNEGKGDNDPFVAPFTPITSAMLASGEIYPAMHKKTSIEYVRNLEDQGEFGHFIWPEHCIIGTEGHAFASDIQKAYAHYETSTGRFVNVVTKGSNPFTEHFGAFRANIPQSNDPSTQVNQAFLQQLQSLDVMYFTGEARSHCVANSLRQLCDEVPTLLPKMVIITDGMSDVPGMPAGFMDNVQGIYDRAKSMGAQFAKFEEITSI